MYNIRYYYSSISKQIFICVLLLSVLTRFVLFFISGMYKEAYVGATVVLYLLIFSACIFCLLGYRFYLGSFDDSRITFKNLLKKTTIDYDDISKVNFTKSKINIYTSTGGDKPQMAIPHYRFGPVSPVGVENFYAMMRNKGIPAQMEPGGIPTIASSFLFTSGYLVLSALIFFNSFNYMLLIYLVLTTARLKHKFRFTDIFGKTALPVIINHWQSSLLDSTHRHIKKFDTV